MQREQCIKQFGGERVISLDPFIKGSYNLEISRRYDYMGMDMLNYVSRPGSPSLNVQLSRIPKGKYVLYDDDICTGKTMAFARNLLAQRGIEIIKQASYISGYKPGEVEVLDARDFIEGEEYGGLVIGNENNYHRRPYTLPWVLPSVRASIYGELDLTLD